MANAVKPLYGTVTAFTKTLASLASSTAGVGRQTTLVDLSTSRPQKLGVSVKITLGTSPTANTAVYVYAIRSDKNGTALRDDGAGASDAAWTRKSAELVRRPNGDPLILYTGAAPSTGDVLTGVGIIDDPGQECGIGIVHDTGVNLNSTEGNHTLSYWTINDEIQ